MTAQSTKYLAWFSTALKLYPVRHREEYGPLMRQHLADRLEEAEGLHDPHVLRDIFLAALLELPASLFHEHIRGGRAEVGLNPLGWRLFSWTALLLAAVSSLGSLGQEQGWLWDSLIPGAWLIIAAGLALVIFIATRRAIFLFWLAAVYGLGFLVASYASYYFFQTQNVHGYAGSVVVPWLSGEFLPVLFSYLFVWYVVRNAKRFRRPSLAGLTKAQLEEVTMAMRRRRARTLTIVESIATIVLVANLAGLYYPKPEYQDLAIGQRLIPDEQNMYKDLAALPTSDDKAYTNSIRAISMVDPESFGKATWDENAARALLAGQEDTLAAFAAASAKPLYQDPAMADPARYTTASQAVNVRLSDLQAVPRAAYLTLLHGELARRTGDAATALRDDRATLKVANAMLGNQQFILPYLVAARIQNAALQSLQHLIAAGGLTPDQAAETQVQIAALTPASQAYSSSVKTEYYGQRLVLAQLPQEAGLLFGGTDNGALEGLSSAFLHVPYLYQPNRTVALADGRIREAIRLANQPCTPASAQYVYPQQNLWQEAVTLVSFNGLGRWLATQQEAFGTMNQSHCAADFQAAATRVSLGLYRWQADHAGQLPVSLTELVPDYMSSVPKDTFEGGEIGYDPKARKLTSVGGGATYATKGNIDFKPEWLAVSF